MYLCDMENDCKYQIELTVTRIVNGDKEQF